MATMDLSFTFLALKTYENLPWPVILTQKDKFRIFESYSFLKILTYEFLNLEPINDHSNM